MTENKKKGVPPTYVRRSPKDHPFTPVKPESTLCKWCMFHENAHIKVDEEK